MKWGTITWFVLHTLSVKISKEHYFKVKHDLFKHIKQLCFCLPCPMCATHATQYVSKLSAPNSKDDFIKFLVDFHNSVNLKLKKPMFPLEQASKYKNVNMVLAFNAFKHIIQKQPYNPKAMMDRIKTRDCVNRLDVWLKQQGLI